MERDGERRIEVTLPADGSEELEPREVAQQLRLLWVLERVRAHAISVGRGAELAGMRYAEFLLLLGKHGISLFDYDDDDLADELAPLR